MATVTVLCKLDYCNSSIFLSLIKIVPSSFRILLLVLLNLCC